MRLLYECPLPLHSSSHAQFRSVVHQRSCLDTRVQHIGGCFLQRSVTDWRDAKLMLYEALPK